MKLLPARKRGRGSIRLFVASLEQAVLAFLIEHEEKSFYGIELADDAGLSRGGVNQALHVLDEAGLVLPEDAGVKRLYRANIADPRVQAFKELLEAASRIRNR